MESEREPTDEIEKFAERILAEPEYRRMVLAVLCASGKKFRPLIADETLLQKLIGPPLQAKTIVTLFRTLQGAEYPEFCSDLFEAAKILTELGAVEEGMTLFISIGLICFGGAGLSAEERKEVLAFLQNKRKMVNIPKWMPQVIDDYQNQILEPKIEIYRQLRKIIMGKIRNPDQLQHELTKNLVTALVGFTTAAIGISIVAFFGAPDKDPTTPPDGAADTLPKSPDAPTMPSAPNEPDKIHQAAPFSHASTICGSSGERTTFGFVERDREVRVICGMEDNEPSLEIAERFPERTVNCIDLGRDDIPDACGTREADDEEFEMLLPPRENLNRWFQEMIQEAAKRINH